MQGAAEAQMLTNLTPIPPENVLRRYIISLAAGLAAILLRWLLDPLLGHVAFYVTVYIAVAYCAVVCGYIPAALSGVIGFLGIFYWFMDPRHSFAVIHSSEIHATIGFFLVSAVLIALGGANRNKQLRLNETIDALTKEARERQRAEQDLRKAHDQLEARVLQRTGELSKALDRLQSEISVRQQAEIDLRQLSVRLMTLQDEERRRIARDLHDTVGQTLAAVKMSIALIRQVKGSPATLPPLIDDLNALADEALQEVRTTSYLLHPPLLDEAGIAPAVRWFVEGFARRSGIHIECDIPQNLERPSRDRELVLSASCRRASPTCTVIPKPQPQPFASPVPAITSKSKCAITAREFQKPACVESIALRLRPGLASPACASACSSSEASSTFRL